MRWRFSLRKLLLAVCGAGVLAMLVYAFLPQPAVVDLAAVARGPLQVTVNEDGKTRIKERYVISAPLGGNLRRIELDAGDPVVRGETLLASIEPRAPELLDAREIAEREAKVRSAEAALDLAQTSLEKAEAALNFAESELGRVRQLERQKAASPHEVEETLLQFRTRSEEYRGAAFSERIAQFELELARAALLRAQPGQKQSSESWDVAIHAPIDGQVLRVFQESAATIAAGTSLVELGDPADLEMEIDVLSRDAARILPGARVWVEEWGGDEPLPGVVRVVEPAGFTKISALGVEEQRVNVIADFTGPPERRATLGDAYRVEARIVVWEADDVLTVPSAALFRQGRAWAVFRVVDGQARVQTVQIGRQGNLQAQVLDGLREGDRVIVYPGDQVRDGVAVRPRSQ